MKKKIILVLVFIFIIVFFNLKNEINLYVGNSSPSKYDNGIDIIINIDDDLIINDSIFYDPFVYLNATEKLKYGFHKLSFFSNKAGIKEEKIIFLFFNQHIVIEFFPNDSDIIDRPQFSVQTRFNPFYYE